MRGEPCSPAWRLGALLLGASWVVTLAVACGGGDDDMFAAPGPLPAAQVQAPVSGAAALPAPVASDPSPREVGAAGRVGRPAQPPATQGPLMDATRSPAPLAAPWVMLLSVWPGADVGPATGWHARIVLPDARTREFDSPFELAQFLSRALRQPVEPGPGSGGLR